MSRAIAAAYRLFSDGLPGRLREPTAVTVGQALLQNPGLAAFRAALRDLPRRVPIIVSVAGESADDDMALASALGPLGALREVNVSSLNTRLVYEWSARPASCRPCRSAWRPPAGCPSS